MTVGRSKTIGVVLSLWVRRHARAVTVFAVKTIRSENGRSRSHQLQQLMVPAIGAWHIGCTGAGACSNFKRYWFLVPRLRPAEGIPLLINMVAIVASRMLRMVAPQRPAHRARSIRQLVTLAGSNLKTPGLTMP